jgi:hypothetical protein
VYELGARFGIDPADGQQHPPPARRPNAQTRSLPRAGRHSHPPLRPRLVTHASRRTPQRPPHHRADQTPRTRHPHPRLPRTTPILNKPTTTSRRNHHVSARPTHQRTHPQPLIARSRQRTDMPMCGRPGVTEATGDPEAAVQSVCRRAATSFLRGEATVVRGLLRLLQPSLEGAP